MFKMAELLKAVSSVVWAETFWLPSNGTWDLLENKPGGVYHAQFGDLLIPFYLSIVIQAVKYVFENYVFAAIGRSLHLKEEFKKATPNPVLEEAFLQSKAPSEDKLQGLSKQTDLSVRQIQRWFRVRRNQDRTPVFKRFCESSWRCLFYFVIFWWGVYIHLDKSWFYDTMQCWKGWPEHHVTNDIFWYYMIEEGFYYSLLFSLFTDHKRKDFVEMIVHHVATLMLMNLSWVNNFVRIGTLVLLVHDAVDSWMEAAKIAKYIGQDKLCTVLFFIFMIVWVITRMMIFPFRIIYSTMFESLPGLDMKGDALFTIYTVYNFLLCTLQVLHIIWFYYIALIAMDALTGQVKKDSRSSAESSSDGEDDKKESHHGGGDEGKKSLNGLLKSKKVE